LLLAFYQQIVFAQKGNPEFNILDKELTAKLNILAKKIEPKVYEYEFLMK